MFLYDFNRITQRDVPASAVRRTHSPLMLTTQMAVLTASVLTEEPCVVRQIMCGDRSVLHLKLLSFVIEKKAQIVFSKLPVW